MSGWKLIAIVGGGTIVIGGGYLLWNYFGSSSSPLSPSQPPKPKEGILEKFAKFLFGEKIIDSGENFIDSTLSIPGNVQTMIKWLAIGGGILVALLVLVFVYRMAIGNTPDISGGVSQIMGSLPQAQMVRYLSPM